MNRLLPFVRRRSHTLLDPARTTTAEVVPIELARSRRLLLGGIIRFPPLPKDDGTAMTQEDIAHATTDAADNTPTCEFDTGDGVCGEDAEFRVDGRLSCEEDLPATIQAAAIALEAAASTGQTTRDSIGVQWLALEDDEDEDDEDEDEDED